MSELPKFEKKNVQNVKGRRPSKYDAWLAEFRNPGDCLYFDPEVISKTKASSIAARFRHLTDKPFHSFHDVKEGRTCIRLRTPTELTKDVNEGEEEDEEDVNHNGDFFSAE